MKARKRHLGFRYEECAETFEFYLDLSRFLTWLMTAGRNYLPSKNPSDILVQLIPGATSKTKEDPYWAIYIEDARANRTTVFYALEVPIAASASGGRTYYKARDPSYGLPLPIWTGPELSVFDDFPWANMRKNPEWQPCEETLNFFVALGGFSQWMDGKRFPPGFTYDALAVDKKEGTARKTPHWELSVFELSPNWRDNDRRHQPLGRFRTYWAISDPLHNPGFGYWSAETGEPLEDVINWKSPPRKWAPVWTAPNGAFYVYDWNVWDEVYV